MLRLTPLSPLSGVTAGLLWASVARGGADVVTLAAHVPVLEFRAFQSDLRVSTLGEYDIAQSFDHWQALDSDPLLPGTHANALVLERRKEKGLRPGIPELTDYLDKL